LSFDKEKYEAFANKMAEYRVKNGERALSTHIFKTGLESEPNEKLPFLKQIEGFPVMVKSHNDHEVTLINLSDYTELCVPMATYQQRCANIWQPDEAMRLYNPTQFQYESEMIKSGMKICGFE